MAAPASSEPAFSTRRVRARRFPGPLVVLVLLALITAGCSRGEDDEAETIGVTGERSVALQDAQRRGGAGSGADGAGATEAEGGVDVAPGEPTEPEPTPDGTVVVALGIEPPDLHYDRPGNQLPVTAWIREPVLEGLFGVGADLEFHPELLADEPGVTANADGTVRIEYRLRSGLRWSDGKALTAADVAYTHEILVDGCEVEADGSIVDGSLDGCLYDGGSRIGINLVTSFEVTDETGFSITLANFYPAWRSLYRTVFAAHAFGDDGADVNRRLATLSGPDGPLPASGPLRFEAWEPGRAITLARNDEYHGSTGPDARNREVAEVEAVRIDFIPDPGARVEGLLSGRVDVILDQPTAAHRGLVGDERFTPVRSGATEFEHLGLNLLNPHLEIPEVRRALALALDKDALAAAAYENAPTDGVPGPLGNSYWMPEQAGYVDHQAALAGSDPNGARDALAAAGYQPESDGGHRHPRLGPLELRVGTTGGDDQRERMQEVLVDQLTEAGFTVSVDNVPGGDYFRQRPFSEFAMAAASSGGTEGDPGVWDVAQFAWVGGPWPGGQSGAYRSRVASNPYGFANPEFDVRANECDATVDDDDRAACYNELDLFVTTLERGEDGLFVIPIMQKPRIYGFAGGRLASVGAAFDSEWGGPLVNVVDYSFG